MNNVSFEVSREVGAAINLASARYQALLASKGLPAVDALELDMDLTACHANGCPMDWESLNAADDFTLAHDVGGIQRHINRRTGKLEHCFLPRCAVKEQKV
ncbi:hypothetical protein [Burkholderia ubonensis]|uniref:DUF6874 family protein n=1 Tax=Burkholderia ubonensis TaxID=101571 RepID=UPI00075EBC31|nr:hypothetical protein [Burkholderia ubonensis]KVW63476.1 hypothetical protein WK99_13085 [Burkholderia ubonensis]